MMVRAGTAKEIDLGCQEKLFLSKRNNRYQY